MKSVQLTLILVILQTKTYVKNRNYAHHKEKWQFLKLLLMLLL